MARRRKTEEPGQTWVFDAEAALSDEQKAARTERQSRRAARAEAKAKAFDPDNPATYHRNYKLLQGIPTHEGVPPISLPAEVCHFIACHVWDDDKLNCSDPREPQIKHVDSPAGPNIAMNAGAWVKSTDPAEPALPEALPVPDFTSLPAEALAAIEAGVQQARITALKVAGADPEARAEAEAVVAARESAPIPDGESTL